MTDERKHELERIIEERLGSDPDGLEALNFARDRVWERNFYRRVLTYYTSCAAATLEGEGMMSRTSKSSRERFVSILAGMVDVLKGTTTKDFRSRAQMTEEETEASAISRALEAIEAANQKDSKV